MKVLGAAKPLSSNQPDIGSLCVGVKRGRGGSFSKVVDMQGAAGNFVEALRKIAST